MKKLGYEKIHENITKYIIWTIALAIFLFSLYILFAFFQIIINTLLGIGLILSLSLLGSEFDRRTGRKIGVFIIIGVLVYTPVAIYLLYLLNQS